jgi:hypothetical protein
MKLEWAGSLIYSKKYESPEEKTLNEKKKKYFRKNKISG